MADISGTGGRDTFNGTTANDILSGGDSGDRVFAGAGDDFVYGHSVADTQAGSNLIDLQRVASGLASPVFGTAPPGVTNQLYILEQATGRIRTLNLDSGGLETFLDIPDGQFVTGGEQGVLGLAFHPQWAANGRLFLHLTNAQGNVEVREYNSRDPGFSGPNPEPRTIIQIPHPSFTNHNGGWIGFGPDGMLYVNVGDGGSGGDPQNNAQNLNSLLGKVLRLDIDSDAFPADAARNYAIPAGNPFAGATAGADEIWVYGLRNPWRASFDTANGDLWIGDVGQGAREEVDVVRAGQSGLNFGWRFREGFLPFNGTAPAGLTDPVLDYDRVTPLFRGFSVTGGYVYHGPGGLDGAYIFADFGSANLWSVRLQNGQALDFTNRNAQLVLSGGGDLDQISSFAVDGSGRLYVIGLDGDIHRLTPRATAGDGQDYLRGEEGNDRIFGGAGFDDVHGNLGDDTVSGGLEGDWVVGGQGNDMLFGDEGGDIVVGNLGSDTADGGEGDDVIVGGQAGDILMGGAGADLISGDRGDDTLTGGAGADLFQSFGEANLDRITDFSTAQGDRLKILAGYTWTVSQQGGDVVVDISGGARAVLSGVSMSSLTGEWIFSG